MSAHSRARTHTHGAQSATAKQQQRNVVSVEMGIQSHAREQLCTEKAPLSKPENWIIT